MGKVSIAPKKEEQPDKLKFGEVLEYDRIDKTLGQAVVMFYKGRKHVATVNTIERKIYVNK